MQKYENVYRYPGGKEPGILDPTHIKVVSEDFFDSLDCDHITFVRKDGKDPALPLKMWGNIWHTGWDIPSCWAIDADNNCWADESAHCGYLELISTSDFLNLIGNESTHTRIYELLGCSRPKTYVEKLEDKVKIYEQLVSDIQTLLDKLK